MKHDEESARLVRLAEALWLLSIAPTPIADAYRAALEAPVVGDLVVVRHTRRSAKPRDRVGLLQEVRTPHSGSQWTIRTLRGLIKRWENVHVIQVQRFPRFGADGRIEAPR